MDFLIGKSTHENDVDCNCDRSESYLLGHMPRVDCILLRYVKAEVVGEGGVHIDSRLDKFDD